MTLTVSDHMETLVKHCGPQMEARTTHEENNSSAAAAVSTGTCRCLFGRAERAADAAAAAALRASLAAVSAARWGFDFAAGRPLPGDRFDWTQVDDRRRPGGGNDVRDRAALQPVNGDAMTSSDHVARTSSSSSPSSKRRRSSAVTSSHSHRRRRRQKSACFDDVIGNAVAYAPPASRQHRAAKCRRHVITGAYRRDCQ